MRTAPKAEIYSTLFDWRKPGEYYRNVTVRAQHREVQVSISPTGSSVMVFVDGVQIPERKKD
jgi:predicted Rdx family selenoprotein